ncbi:hypothetical protein CDAR_281381 [Caerostris darwini]|uniref:Uncharacterized protein n=1 Tax=Caerostris darwini TaxID=1538125 RepID=A0AAV4TFV4_9ARAC|nr:hypothetical protein CDAR_281381 [Caerostris darwini]
MYKKKKKNEHPERKWMTALQKLKSGIKDLPTRDSRRIPTAVTDRTQNNKFREWEKGKLQKEKNEKASREEVDDSPAETQERNKRSANQR